MRKKGAEEEREPGGGRRERSEQRRRGYGKKEGDWEKRKVVTDHSER